MIKIDINLVFTIINLLVLYLLMKKFLFGPIINVMDQRKAMIDQQFAEAKERQDNAKALQEQYEGALKSAKEESYQIMEQARKEAKAQADHTVEETTAKVDAMLAKAQEDIPYGTRECNASDERRCCRACYEAAAKVIGKNSGADQDLSLYDQFIEEAGDPDDSDRRYYAKNTVRAFCFDRSRTDTKEIFREVPWVAESLRTHWCLLKQRAE